MVFHAMTVWMGSYTSATSAPCLFAVAAARVAAAAMAAAMSPGATAAGPVA